jgi:hypothetical protein
VRGYITNTARRRALQVSRELVCSGERSESSRTIRTNRRGRFTLVLSPPGVVGQSAIFRIRIRGSAVVTLPIVLTR